MKILVAEDDRFGMLIVEKILTDLKVTATTCENGKLAVNKLKEDSGYDLVLLDLEMPVMDGYTALKEIKTFLPKMPVLAFTAASIDKQLYTNLTKHGFEDCVFKPYKQDELHNIIKKYGLQETSTC